MDPNDDKAFIKMLREHEYILVYGVPDPKNYREKCSYADKYKGIKEPKCNCRTCWKIYLEKNYNKDEKSNTSSSL